MAIAIDTNDLGFAVRATHLLTTSNELYINVLIFKFEISLS